MNVVRCSSFFFQYFPPHPPSGLFSYSRVGAINGPDPPRGVPFVSDFVN